MTVCELRQATAKPVAEGKKEKPVLPERLVIEFNGGVGSKLPSRNSSINVAVSAGPAGKQQIDKKGPRK